MSPRKNNLIGVLALQGGFAEHQRALKACGAKTVLIRRPEDTKEVTALVIPGGESTVLRQLLQSSGLEPWLKKRLREGMPCFGTCAGLILLSNLHLKGINIQVDRNAYGGQLESFEDDVTLWDKKKFPAVFIRAPKITRIGPEVKILGRHGTEPVLLAQKNVLVAAFHPELTEDVRLHRWWTSSFSR